MQNFVRILGIIFLLISSIILIVKLWVFIPIQPKYLIILFFVGAISLMWANLRDNKKD